MSNTKKSSLILPVILLVSILLIPMYDTWQGIIPGEDAYTVPVIFETLVSEEDALHYWPVIFFLSALIPAIILLITALIHNKWLSVAASGLGTLLLLIRLFGFIGKNGADEVFKLDDCSICIGFWIALILFIVNFIYALKIRTAE